MPVASFRLFPLVTTAFLLRTDAIEYESCDADHSKQRGPRLHSIFPSQVMIEPTGLAEEQLAEVVRLVRNRYDQVAPQVMKSAHENELSHAGTGAQAVNEEFFFMQRKWEETWWSTQRACLDARRVNCDEEANRLNEWSELRILPAFHAMKRALQREIATYLKAVGAPDYVANGSVNWWFGVHRDGIWHVPHTHARTTVAGTVYLQATGGKMGRLCFMDPRKAMGDQEAREAKENGKADLGSFDAGLCFKAQAGDVVLFPPWLQHTVERTRVDEPRIALSFNLEGGWAEHNKYTTVPLESRARFAATPSAICTVWASGGECDSNPIFMTESCMQACEEDASRL